MLGGIRSAWIRGEVHDERATLAVDDLAAMPVERVPDSVLLHDAWALRHNVSASDALYVALARRLGCPLITLDRRLAAAPGLGDHRGRARVGPTQAPAGSDTVPIEAGGAE